MGINILMFFWSLFIYGKDIGAWGNKIDKVQSVTQFS
jgi:hypothetical protein